MTNKNNDLGTLKGASVAGNTARVLPQEECTPCDPSGERAHGRKPACRLPVSSSLTICSCCLCRSDICQRRVQLNAEFHQSFQRISKPGHGLGDSYLTCKSRVIFAFLNDEI